MPEPEFRRLVDRSEALAVLPRPTSHRASSTLVMEALDGLPEEFQELLEHTPVVVSNRGHEHRAYGHYIGGTIARDTTPTGSSSTRTRWSATSATTPTCSGPRSSAPCATRWPTTWAGTSPGYAASVSEAPDRLRPYFCALDFLARLGNGCQYGLMSRSYPIGAVVVALALLVGAQSAHGAVTHRAKVWYYQQPHSYDEASKTLTLNYRLYSNNKRCIDKYSISEVDLVLYFQPDGEYATGDGPFTNLVRSQDTFTLKRVGLGHYSISLPGAQNVATVNPGGSYGGTYSLESVVEGVDRAES